MGSNPALFQEIERHFILFIQNAFLEDIQEADHTSEACIPADKHGQAKLLVKDQGILAGVEMARRIFYFADQSLELEAFLNDGASVRNGDVAFTVKGSLRSILKSERIVLNCMQRMSGIATKTHQMVQRLKGTGTRLLDTRKTTPGIRFLEKWAVAIGGGENHRFGLYDMIMIKDNHIDAAGGIGNAIAMAKSYLQRHGLNLAIEVETRSLEEVQEVLKHGPVQRIMLDNFSPDLIQEALTLISGKCETEASGGINDTNLAQYAQTGVNYISSGAITHSAMPLDLSLKVSFV
ncbi:MAG: carboxylating nicotinate-nucleotide diphosphorylase [Bacteroidia bacterium]